MAAPASFGTVEQVLWPASVFSGIVMCKIVYDATFSISKSYFKDYNKLSESVKIEWNNRGISTFHAVLAAVVSFYLLVMSNLFKVDASGELMINRKSVISDGMFGISIGYFIVDMGMILWCFPSLGGAEYILHHVLSMYSFGFTLLIGKAHIYILMVLFSEVTTPFVNLRWYLDTAGKKASKLYLYNGIALFLGWLVARTLLFVYIFVHMYRHFDQARTICPLGIYSLVGVPATMAAMNAIWFRKIFMGIMKTLSKRSHLA